MVKPFTFKVITDRYVSSAILLLDCFLMWTLARSVRDIVAETRQIHMDYRVLWKKKVGTATLSGGEHPNPCLERLLLAFLIAYVKEGFHSLYLGLL